MRPKNIFIVRHGQSQANVDKTLHQTIPDHKIELTPLGWEQARAAGKELNQFIGDVPVAFYTSPYVRTRQTLRGILEGFRTVDVERIREDPRIREQEWGHLRVAEQTDAVDAERQDYGPFYYRIPDGESGADVYDRVTGFLDTIYRDFENPEYPENAVIVSHGFTLRVLLMRWLKWSVEEFHELANPKNCAIFRLERDNTAKKKYHLFGTFPKSANTPRHP